MKNFIRFFAMSVALTGLISSSFAAKANDVIPSHLAAVSSGPGPWSLPIPTCFPGAPNCPSGETLNTNF